MADFMDWLQGSSERRLQDLEAQKRQYDKITGTPDYRALRAMRDEPIGDIDPRSVRMSMVMDQLTPMRSSDAADSEVAALDYAFNMGVRPRDTAIRAAQELSQGNHGTAAGLAASALPSMLIPSMAAGTRGAPDDWRESARKAGVSEGNIALIDYGTDPEMYVAAPLKGPAAFLAPALPMAVARGAMGRADDVLRAIERARYGQGASTYLVDPAGEVIRRLRNSPPSMPLALPAR